MCCCCVRQGTANRAWLQRLVSATANELADEVIPAGATANAAPACPVGSSLRSAQFKARLMSPCISRSAQQKVEKVLTELGVRPVPMPTEVRNVGRALAHASPPRTAAHLTRGVCIGCCAQRVVEEHSKLRQDILLMLALHKLVAKRQKQAAGLIEQRSRLANVGPASVLQAMTASRVAAQQAAQRAKAQAKAQQKALAAKKAAQAAAHASSASTAQMAAPAPASGSAASHSSKGAKNSKAASVSNKANSKKPNSKNARPHSGKKARTSAASKKKAAATAPAASGGGGKGFVSAGRGEVMAIGGGGKGKGTMPAPRSVRRPWPHCKWWAAPHAYVCMCVCVCVVVLCCAVLFAAPSKAANHDHRETGKFEACPQVVVDINTVQLEKKHVLVAAVHSADSAPGSLPQQAQHARLTIVIKEVRVSSCVIVAVSRPSGFPTRAVAVIQKIRATAHASSPRLLAIRRRQQPHERQLIVGAAITAVVRATTTAIRAGDAGASMPRDWRHGSSVVPIQRWCGH